MEIKELTDKIDQIKTANQFKKYIEFIQFPYYRNLEANTRITFSYPLTVFIGQNGCGKSSALHALYGAVFNKTPSEFWFDTKVDPVEYYDDAKRRHSFWYGYKDGKTDKEVVKARIKRKDDPNYWETSRPLIWAGMKRGNKNRSAPIVKDVLYLDFRGELSAFDKFFYFGNIKRSKARNKQEFIRTKSRSLKKLFSGEESFIKSSKRNLNEALENLDSEALKNISFILGRDYTSGKSIKHSLFRNEGYSILFETKFASYSEAFAGSGEMAVVRLVTEVLSASESSLILLDEPEVSLHPGAQQRLKIFLLEQIKKKKHQVVLTSHSPSIIKDLPSKAIKVFYQNPGNGRFLIKEDMLPEEAFYHIEFPLDNRKTIIVEDKLAVEIIKAVLKRLGSETESLFNVKFFPGGESVIKNEFATVYCREPNSKEYLIFDGDQKKSDNHYDWKKFPTSDLTVDFLKEKIKQQVGIDITFSTDSGNAETKHDQILELQKKYLNYFITNVWYLPGNIPEDIIWDAEKAKQLTGLDFEETILVKEKFAKLSQELLGNNKSTDIESAHKIFIKSWIDKENEDFTCIKNLIDSIRKQV